MDGQAFDEDVFSHIDVSLKKVLIQEVGEIQELVELQDSDTNNHH